MKNDFAVKQVLQFVEKQLGKERQRVLDVGAGAGELSWLLQQAGYRVTALEPNPEHQAELERGEFDLITSPIEELDSLEFDAILFVRSLHHVNDLFQALNASANMLASNGVLVVDDFDLGQMDKKTVEWVAETTRQLAERDMLEMDEGFADSTIGRVLYGDDPLEPWEETRAHVHPAEDMVAEIGKHFRIESVARGPYLYRYFGEHVRCDAKYQQVLPELLDRELEGIERQAINPIALRVTAAKLR